MVISDKTLTFANVDDKSPRDRRRVYPFPRKILYLEAFMGRRLQ